MGYTTDFDGQFDLDKPLTESHRKYLTAFARTRRMKRDAKKTKELNDPIRIAVGLPVGLEGGYFVGESGLSGQNESPDVLDCNRGPIEQPGLWCQWEPNEEGTAVIWDGGEKLYNYVEWINYLISHFLEPWGYVLNGEVCWTGEDNLDLGKIIITNNVVEVKIGKIVYE